MAVTRLKRKGAKNKSRAKTRVKDIQRLNQKPVFKTVDVEAIKAEWAEGDKKAPAKKKATKKEAAPKAEAAKSEEPAAEASNEEAKGE